jgi:FG-GAP-like repeat
MLTTQKTVVCSTLAVLLAAAGGAQAADRPTWIRLSSKTGALPTPGTSVWQTACLVLDIDKDGLNDIVVGSRREGAALTWFRRNKEGWTIHPIDRGLNIEAGGVAADLDGDGDLDLIFGEDYTGSKLYWWENPYPDYTSRAGWTRREIKSTGERTQHDQAFGDFDGDGHDELAFWVQDAKALLLAEPPRDPRRTGPWPTTTIARIGRAEGLAAADVDVDGTLDLIGGGYWFRHEGGSTFRPIPIDPAAANTRAAAGQLVEGGPPEVVFSAGDEIGRLKWYQRRGDVWAAHDLLGGDVIHGHSLQLADIDQDGHLDIFCAEMAKWSDGEKRPDNPHARMWIFFGDGRGGFAKTTLATGIDNHESCIADLDGDGDFDIVVKPYSFDTPRLDVWLNRGTGPRKRGPGSGP